MYIHLEWDMGFSTTRGKYNQPLVKLENIIKSISQYASLSPIRRSESIHDDISEYLETRSFIIYTQFEGIYLIINPKFDTDHIIDEFHGKYLLNEMELRTLRSEITYMKSYMRNLIINDIIE